MNKEKTTQWILFLPVIELLGVIVPAEDIRWLVSYAHAEIIILCLCGYLGMKKDLWLFVLLYLFWVGITDLFKFDILQELALIEATAFAVIVWWLYKRPARIPSDPQTKHTVQVAFCHGDKFILVAKIASFIGLPVTGVGIIIDGEGILVRGKTGILEKRKREEFRKWIILDTKIKINKQIVSEFDKLEGLTPSKSGCMVEMTPFLSSLGDHYKPSLFESPSSYMSHILSLRN